MKASGFNRLGPVRKNAGNQEVASSRTEVLTEISEKFDLRELHDEMCAAGFIPVASWRDRGSDFSVTLARVKKD